LKSKHIIMLPMSGSKLKSTLRKWKRAHQRDRVESFMSCETLRMEPASWFM